MIIQILWLDFANKNFLLLGKLKCHWFKNCKKIGDFFDNLNFFYKKYVW